MKPEPLDWPLLVGFSTVLSLSSNSSHDLRVAGAIAAPLHSKCQSGTLFAARAAFLVYVYYWFFRMCMGNHVSESVQTCKVKLFKVKVFHAIFYNCCSGLVHFVNPFSTSALPTSEYPHLFSNSYLLLHYLFIFSCVWIISWPFKALHFYPEKQIILVDKAIFKEETFFYNPFSVQNKLAFLYLLHHPPRNSRSRSCWELFK